MNNLSQMQELAIRDAKGNCRCPYCGKYRKRSEFEKQAGHANIDSGAIKIHLHIPPACIYCHAEAAG